MRVLRVLPVAVRMIAIAVVGIAATAAASALLATWLQAWAAALLSAIVIGGIVAAAVAIAVGRVERSTPATWNWVYSPCFFSWVYRRPAVSVSFGEMFQLTCPKAARLLVSGVDVELDSNPFNAALATAGATVGRYQLGAAEP